MNRLTGWCGAALMFCSTLASAGGGNVTGVVGFRQLHHQWDPTDTQAMGGILADFSFWEAPIHLELGLRGSGDSGDFTDSGFSYHARQEVDDFSVGVLLIPDYGYVRPYFGLGFEGVSTYARLTGNDVSFYSRDDDSSPGYYLAAGLMWRLTPNFDLGIDARYLGGTDVQINGVDTDINSYTVGLRIGYGWDLNRRNEYYRHPRRPRRPYPY